MEPEKHRSLSASPEGKSPQDLPERQDAERVQGEIDGLTARQQGQLRNLIIHEPNLGAEFKALAHADLPLLIKYIVATREESSLTAGSSPEEISVQIQEKGFALPSSAELKELGEILSEILHLPVLKAGEVRLRQISAQYEIAEFKDVERMRAGTVLAAFGPLHDIYCLAVRAPQLFEEYLQAKEDCERQPQDKTLDDVRSEVADRIEQAGFRVPLDREIRRYRAQQIEERDADHEIKQLLANSQELLADFSEMVGLEKEIARGVLIKYGLENALFRLAVQMPEEFRHYVQLAHDVDKSPDSESAAAMRDLKLSIRAQGLNVPAGNVLIQCVWIINRAIAEDDARVVRAIQAEINGMDCDVIPDEGIDIIFDELPDSSDDLNKPFVPSDDSD